MDDQKTLEEEIKETFTGLFLELDAALIRVRLKERKLTLKDLQRKVGVSYRTVHRWISGSDLPNPQNLVQLAHVLDLELHQLVIKKFDSQRSNDDIRFVQRQIENLVHDILDDAKIPPEKKLDMLVKYHNVLTKKRK